ncbi:MAG: LapA family protein [Comamonas sp.]|nr:LapA family protein [Comamonas sp.]
MKARTALLVLIVALLGYLAFFNFASLAQDVPMSLGFTEIHGPLGLVMLALSALMAAIFLAYVIAMQATWLLEVRSHNKALQAQRELAEKAEISRFTDLRGALDDKQQQLEKRLMERMDALESHLKARAQESDNVHAAYIGQLEEQLRGKKPEQE